MVEKTMIVKIKRKYFLVFSVILFISLASASFAVGNLSHSIQKSYAPGGTITGWVNISFNSEPADSVFTSSEGGSIELKKLLDKNNNFQYSCNPTTCGSDYSTEEEGNTITFNLNKGESKFVGFKFNERIERINSVSFKIESDAGLSCENQLKINFLEGEIYTGNNKPSTEFCPIAENHGCFNDELTLKTYILDTIPYCQKINLTESPGFELGAWVKEMSAGAKKLTMSLYDIYGEKITNCSLSNLSGTSSGKKVYCEVNYSTSEPEESYVCISGDVGSGTYNIRGYNISNGCGFHGVPPQSYVPAAYEIFAIGKKFSDFGILNVTNSLSGKNLADLIENYIIAKYRSLDCSGGCIAPMEIISGKNQTITLSNLQINYEETSVGQQIKNKFSELKKIAPKISAGFQKLFLDGAGFSAPSNYGNKTFTLNLNDKKVFSELISVDKTIPMINSVNPTMTAAAFPTKFEVNVNSSSNITKYEWNFGNESRTTLTNKIIYTYNTIGVYQLKITITDGNQQISQKVFDINVTSPKDAINFTLNNKHGYLENIKSQINNFSGFYKNSLNSVLNMSVFEGELSKIKLDYANAFSDAEYIKIMTRLVNLKIPKSISTSKVADSILFFPDEKNIDLEIVKSAGGGTYNASDENKYVDAILAWNQANIEMKTDFKRISADYEGRTEDLLNFFELDIKEKKNLNYDYYLIIGLNEINFEENYNEQRGYGYVYLKPQPKIIFSTSDDVDFTNLPAFISPAINKLVISGGGGGGGTTTKLGWSLFFIIIVGLIAVGIVVYIILQEWYKRKYETHLFKDRNNLFNLITYIGNEEKRGLKESEIDAKLKKAGWSDEQRTYALNKYAGRRTGMVEIPGTNFLEKLKGGAQQNK